MLAQGRQQVQQQHPKISPDIQEALAFIKTRYPNFFSKGITPINQTSESGPPAFYSLSDNQINARPGSVNMAGMLAHEMQHKLQFRNPESVRSNLLLGAYPFQQAGGSLNNMQGSGYTGAYNQYRNIPQEKYAYETGDEVSREYELYQKLLRRMKPVISNQ